MLAYSEVHYSTVALFGTIGCVVGFHSGFEGGDMCGRDFREACCFYSVFHDPASSPTLREDFEGMTPMAFLILPFLSCCCNAYLFP